MDELYNCIGKSLLFPRVTILDETLAAVWAKGGAQSQSWHAECDRNQYHRGNGIKELWWRMKIMAYFTSWLSELHPRLPSHGPCQLSVDCISQRHPTPKHWNRKKKLITKSTSWHIRHVASRILYQTPWLWSQLKKDYLLFEFLN